MKRLLVGIATLCLLVSPTFAGTTAGQLEVSGAFQITSPDGADDQYSIQAGGGYFLTDALEVKGTVIVFGGSGDLDTRGFVGAGADYHFLPELDTVPYAGAFIMAQVGDDSSSDALLNLHVGVKQFVTETVSIFYEAAFYTSSGSDASDLVLGQIGISLFL